MKYAWVSEKLAASISTIQERAARDEKPDVRKVG
jgi:primosomal protein N''